MAKSKFDFVSVIIVAACILALIFLIYKTINMYNQNKANQTEVIEDTTTEEEADLYNKEGTYKFDEEGEIVADQEEEGTETDESHLITGLERVSHGVGKQINDLGGLGFGPRLALWQRNVCIRIRSVRQIVHRDGLIGCLRDKRLQSAGPNRWIDISTQIGRQDGRPQVLARF